MARRLPIASRRRLRCPRGKPQGRREIQAQRKETAQEGTQEITEKTKILDLRSQDIIEEKRREILRLFPKIRTEGGKLDFQRLKLDLGEAVDARKERYGMSWPGKVTVPKSG